MTYSTAFIIVGVGVWYIRIIIAQRSYLYQDNPILFFLRTFNILNYSIIITDIEV